MFTQFYYRIKIEVSQPSMKEATVDLLDYFDAATGFTAMERTTGWHAAIMAGLIARGKTPRGGVPVELAVPGPMFVEEFCKRGFDLRVNCS